MGGHVGRIRRIQSRRPHPRHSRRHVLQHRLDNGDRRYYRSLHSLGLGAGQTGHDERGGVSGGPSGRPLLLASPFLPSHNDAHVSEPPALSTQIERTWGLDEMGDCKNTSHGLTDSPSLPKSSLDDGDWKCVAYTDNQRTEVTVHVNGNRVGLYKADGKALKPVGKD